MLIQWKYEMGSKLVKLVWWQMDTKSINKSRPHTVLVKRSMKILIAGLGSIGRRHFRNLTALGEKDSSCCARAKRRCPRMSWPGIPSKPIYRKRLQKHNPDAVIVANPTSLHLDVAIPAAQAGCHILLEKPVSHSLDRLDVLEQAAEKSGSRILVGFQFRYHPTLNKARELIQSNALGRILTVHAHWGEYLPQWHPWEDYRQSYAARADLGGGVIVTLTHPLDYLRYLVGDVESLWSFNGHISPLEVDVEDVAEIGLKFANGATGGVHVNYFQRPPVHRLEIAGTNGTLRWDNADGVLSPVPDACPFGSYSDQPPAPVVESFPPPDGFDRNQLFVEQTRHFLDVARGESEPLCTLMDGVIALRLALAAYESQETGRVVTFTGKR
jgi:predicted dehydrogenase